MRFLQTILAALIAHSYLLGGFAGTTTVVVPNGFRLMQDLQIGDKVFGINEQSKLLVTGISHTLIQKNKQCLDIIIDNQTITVARNQKFLNTQTNKWVKAKNLKVGDTVRTVQFPGIAKVKKIKEGPSPITLYDIRLEDDHVFCITDLTIVVHNCPLFTIGLMWTFNTLADITFSGAVFSIMAPFVCATYALFFNKGSQSKSQLKLQAGCETIMKTKYLDDQLTDCKSQDSYQNPNRQAQCLSSPDSNQVFIGSCDGKSSDDSTLVPGMCDVAIQAINQEQWTCRYSDSSNNQQPIDLEGYQDCLISSAYQKENTKQRDNNAQNIKRHTIKESEHEAGKECDSEICDPPPKGPYGYFIPSDKHKSKPCGDASAGPTWDDGQKALDLSIQVIDNQGNPTKTRIVIQNNRFLVFFPTMKDVWHGHYRSWEELDISMQNTLQRLKMVDGKNGKIL